MTDIPAQVAALRAHGYPDDIIARIHPERTEDLLRIHPERVQDFCKRVRDFWNGGGAPPAPDRDQLGDAPTQPQPAKDAAPEALGTQPDTRAVREFFITLVAQAKAATRHLNDPGVLQIILIHPSGDKVTGIYRYELNDYDLIGRMTSEAVDASEAGHNVYVEGRTVRRGLSGKERGGLADTIAVFALVVDSDGDKGKAWTPTVSISLTVETSPGNKHFWLFLGTALEPAPAQKLGARLRAATNADDDTGNVCQPYRVAGSVNYPGKKKLERGRVITPTYSLGFDPETLWSPERIAQEFQPSSKPIEDPNRYMARGFKNLDPEADDGTLGAGLYDPHAEPELIAAALAVIPRNDNDPHSDNYWTEIEQPPGRNYMIKIGMAVKAASNGSDEGFALFNKWRSGAPDYHADNVRKKYEGFHPTQIGFGTLSFYADKASPGWREEYDARKSNSQGSAQQQQAEQNDSGPARQPKPNLPLIVELGSKLWGPATANGKEYRFGADQSKVVDPIKGNWFDFAVNKGGHIRELMKKVETEANRKQTNTDDVVLVCAADVVMRPLDWIWEGHLLRGSQELMSGLPDLCKSQVQIGHIACATAQLPWPDGAPAIEPMNVIMLTAEDTLDQIVVPRLRAAGADISRVHILKCIKTDEHDRQFLLAEDLERLERLMQKIGDVGFVTMDPITAYMGSKMDSYKATEVRSQLGPLKDLSERTNIALSTITHPPKAAGPRAIDHFIASQAFIAACRVGHLCIAEMEEKDGERVPTGRVLYTNVRNAAHRLMPTLAYRKDEITISTEPRLITAPRIIWEGEVDITAEMAIAAASGKQPHLQPKVQAFLREMLKDDKPVLQKEIEEAAEKNGFTSKQLRTAREKLGVHIFKEPGKMTGPWFWQQSNPSEGRYHY